MKRDDGGSAFPQQTSPAGYVRSSFDGMTLRDYFAAQVISQCQITVTRQEPPEADPALVKAYAYRYARTAYIIADAMLQERKI